MQESAEHLSIIEEMVVEFDKKNVEYFRKMLKHEDYVIRTSRVYTSRYGGLNKKL